MPENRRTRVLLEWQAEGTGRKDEWMYGWGKIDHRLKEKDTKVKYIRRILVLVEGNPL